MPSISISINAKKALKEKKAELSAHKGRPVTYSETIENMKVVKK